jgi:hypothetical protein
MPELTTTMSSLPKSFLIWAIVFSIWSLLDTLAWYARAEILFVDAISVAVASAVFDVL